MTKSGIQAKIRVLKRKLDEMRQYKRMMAEEGQKPDTADKVRESDLIVRLLHLEKQLAEAEGRPYRPKDAEGPKGSEGRPRRPKKPRGAPGPSKGPSPRSEAGKTSDKSSGKPSRKSTDQPSRKATDQPSRKPIGHPSRKPSSKPAEKSVRRPPVRRKPKA